MEKDTVLLTCVRNVQLLTLLLMGVVVVSMEILLQGTLVKDGLDGHF